MNIKIEKTNPSQSIVEENSIKWKLFTKMNKKIILYQFIIGSVFIVLGIIDSNSQPSSLNILLSFGISFVLLAGIYWLQTFQNKKKYALKVEMYSTRHAQSDSKITININDELVKYQDLELSQEVKWSLFTHYKLYNDYLFLIMDDSFLSSIIIHKKNFEEAEFKELHDFVKNKLILKK